MKKYQQMLQYILDNGNDWGDRTGVGRRSVHGYEVRYDLQEGFPLLTTKKMFLRGVFEELLWMISGSTNVKPLIDKNVHIWDQDAYRGFTKSDAFKGELLAEYVAKIKSDADFAAKYGNLGPVYGKQWRNFNGVDQMAKVQESLRNNPDSTRHIISAWNPAEISDMVLPPCHAFVQFYSREQNGRKFLDCQLFQRSADVFLGVPFNIASYATLTMMMAQSTGFEPGEFIHTFGDLHIYLNHFDQVNEQLEREPLPLSQLHLNPNVKNIFDFTMDDIKIENYHSYPTIKAPLNTHPMVYIIAAVAENGVIGNKDVLPWHLPDDIEQFKRRTAGKSVVMGRKTWESIPQRFRPLQERNNIVVSSALDTADGATVVRSLPEALTMAQNYAPEVFIIGGASIYKEALPLTERLYLSEVQGAPIGDAFFPAFNKEKYRRIPIEHHDKFDVVVYQKKPK